MNRITLLLADDHRIVREGFRMLLESQGDFEVIAEAQTGIEAVDLALRLRPAVIVMDIQMPQLDGLEATRRILNANPSAKVLMLSAHVDEDYTEEVARTGALGCLSKQSPAGVLSKTIRDIHCGVATLRPRMKEAHDTRNQKPPAGPLTPGEGKFNLRLRETQVLQMVAEGYHNKGMAKELGISIKTVEKHRQHLMEKLGIHDIAGLTRYAVSSGFVNSRAQLDSTDHSGKLQ